MQLNLTGAVELQAGNAAGTPPKARVLAYSGGIINVGGFGPVLVDLAGLTMAGSIPLLADHNSTLDGVAGSGTPRVEAGTLHVEGTLAGTPAGARVRELAAAGVPLQASVGVSPTDRKFLQSGSKVRANGREHTAGPHGLTLVLAGTLREVSITPLGADPSTSVSIAAKRGTMSTHADTQPAPDARDEIQATESPTEANRRRVDQIHEIKAHFIREYPVRVDEIEQVAAEAIRWGAAPHVASERMKACGATVSPTPQLFIQAGRPEAPPVEALEASMLIRAGREELAVKAYGERTAEAARRMRFSNLADVCRASLRIEGRDIGSMSRSEMIQAAFSTLSLPTALSNVMGKTLLDAYTEATASWRGFAAIRPAADFKPQVAIRPSFVGDLEQLAPAGEIKHGMLDESTFPWKIDTYARMFTVDRQTVINDDLGFISETPVLMASAAARKLNDLAWGLILSGSGSFFTAPNNNLIVDALDAAGLGKAISKMRTQRDEQGNDLQINPRVLVVPPELEFVARALINSTEIGRADGQPTGNALRGLVEVAVEARLSNPKFTGYSATGYYLFGPPSATPIVVGFLDGRQTPVVETFGLDHQVNRLALSFRCYHDFGVALGDHRAALKSTGAGSD